MAVSWFVGVETDEATGKVRYWSGGYVWWDLSEDWVVVGEEC
jgi:hypothetical protein